MKEREKSCSVNDISFFENFFSFINIFHQSRIINYLFQWGVLLPGAPDRAYLINKLIRQREQIVHLRLYFSPLRWYYTGRKKSL